MSNTTDVEVYKLVTSTGEYIMFAIDDLVFPQRTSFYSPVSRYPGIAPEPVASAYLLPEYTRAVKLSGTTFSHLGNSKVPTKLIAEVVKRTYASRGLVEEKVATLKKKLGIAA